MIRVSFDYTTQSVEPELDSNGHVALDGSRETLVFVSMFTDGRAAEDDGIRAKRGWWGNVDAERTIGSRIWIDEQSSTGVTALRRIRTSAMSALAWMVEDGLAQSVDVTVTRSGQWVDLETVVTRPDGTVWSKVWERALNGV